MTRPEIHMLRKEAMRNYLSFGGGVNSVALYLHLLDEGWDFEAVFVDHGTDWPETYEYVEMFRAKYPLTVLKPGSLYDYSWGYKMFPSRIQRWCTRIFKQEALNSYQPKECFVLIGFDYGERHRAKIYTDKGREFRWPLIEAEITREGCKQIIRDHGLPVPPKSGCYICPFQRVGQLRDLRMKHPDLFCRLEQLENRHNEYRATKGKKLYYSFRRPVREMAERNIKQQPLFEADEFPPCECWL